MTAEHWGTVLLTILTLAQAVHIWAKRHREQKDAPEFERRRGDRLIWRVEQLEKRMEDAGHEMSKLATKLQQMPDEFRQYFTAKEVAQGWAETCQRERQELKSEIKSLREKIDESRSGPRRLDAQR